MYYTQLLNAPVQENCVASWYSCYHNYTHHIQRIKNVGAAQVQILLTVCQRFMVGETFGNGLSSDSILQNITGLCFVIITVDITS